MLASIKVYAEPGIIPTYIALIWSLYFYPNTRLKLFFRNIFGNIHFHELRV